MPPVASKVQERLVGTAAAAGLEIVGLTQPDIPGTHGIAVRAKLTSAKLEPLREAGLALSPMGDLVLVEAPREAESVVYLPVGDAFGIAQGSGIVGRPEPGADRVHIYFEGAIYEQAEMARFADRVFYAHGRMIERYETVAVLAAPGPARAAPADSLDPIGTFYPRRGEVVLTGPDAEAALTVWLDVPELDDAELWRGGLVPAS